LREGSVETLAAPEKRKWEPVDLPAAQVDAALAHPSSATVSRRGGQEFRVLTRPASVPLQFPTKILVLDQKLGDDRP
jgi:hypothetical protein